MPPMAKRAPPPSPGAHAAPPPQAPFPPLPPFPRAPPLHLLAEPSALSTCGHLATPVDTTSRVGYPGGSWQYFAEWSGLDESAQLELENGGLSYYYDGSDGDRIRR